MYSLFSAVSFADGFTLSILVEEHMYIFMVALFTFALAIILMSKGAFLTQALLFLATITVSLLTGGTFISLIYGALLVLQVALGLFLVYKFIRAAEINYQLVQEKTLKLPANLKKKDHGRLSSFY